jgi:toxin ParE1/3/4
LIPTYKFTEKAERDLAGIIDYTRRTWGSTQAITYIDGLEKLAGTLAETPDLGKSREDLYKHLIVFPYEKHLIYYRKEKHGITIVRILHESMDAPGHFG